MTTATTSVGMPTDLTRYNFFFCDTKINEDLSSLVLPNATTVCSMLYLCGEFNSPIEGISLPKVTDYRGFLSWAVKFNQPLNNLPMSKAEAITSMLLGCVEFDQPLDKWDLSNVTEYDNALALTKITYEQVKEWGWDKKYGIHIPSLLHGSKSYSDVEAHFLAHATEEEYWAPLEPCNVRQYTQHLMIHFPDTKGSPEFIDATSEDDNTLR